MVNSIEQSLEKSLIPELRFPEFDNDWKKSKLCKFIDFQSGYAFPSTKMLKKGGKYQLIKMTNVYLDELRVDRNPSFFGDIDNKLNNFLLKFGDIVLTLTGTVGKRDYGYSAGIDVNDKYLLNQRLVRLRAKEKKSDSKFVLYLLRTSRFYYSFFNEGKGGTGNQANVGIRDLEQISLNIPSQKEQQKIANFLTAIDQRITLLKQKKAALEQYKKGLMQKIFSQEIRFEVNGVTNAASAGRAGAARPDASKTEEKNSPLERGLGCVKQGESYPDWEEKRLNQICKINPKSKELPQEFIYIDLESVSKGQLNQLNIVMREESPSRAQRLLSKEDILYQMVRPYQRNNYYFDRDGQYVASTGYAQLRPKQNSLFLYYLIHTEKFVNAVLRLCTGSNYPAINSSDLGTVKVQFPCPEEQQKIADCLSAIDQSINQLTNQIDQTTQFKKGLLQRMFV